MSSGHRAQSYPYPRHPVVVPGQVHPPPHWQQVAPPPSSEAAVGEPYRRRHASDHQPQGHAPLHAPLHQHLQHQQQQQQQQQHQWQIHPPPLSSISRISSSDSLSSQNSFSNPRSPTGSVFSSDTEYMPPPPLPPPEYRTNGMRNMSERAPVPSYHGNQARVYSGHSHPGSQDLRRRSAADVYPQSDGYLKVGGAYPHVVGSSGGQMDPSSARTDSRKGSSSGLVHIQRTASLSRPQPPPQDPPGYATPPTSQPPPLPSHGHERNLYERVGDVVNSSGFQSNHGQSRVELRRAPSSQSISSTGSGSHSVHRARRASSKDGYQNHTHPLRMQDIHYRQGSSDSGSQYRGESGSHGNMTGNFQSPDSGDSGFVGSELGGDPVGVCSEIQRSGFHRPGFSRAQTLPAEVWPEQDGNKMHPWYSGEDHDGVEMGAEGPTVPHLSAGLVAGKPNGRYFPFSPPQPVEAEASSTRRMMRKSKSGSTLPLRSPQVVRSKAGTLDRIARKFNSRKSSGGLGGGGGGGGPPEGEEQETEDEQAVLLAALHKRSNSFSVSEDFNSRGRRTQSLERLNESKSPTEESEGKGILATIGTPKMFRNKKFKKVGENDSTSLSGSLSNLFKSGSDKGSGSSKKAGLTPGSIDALFAAIMTQEVERVQLLLSTEVMDLNSRNEDGFTPLDLAVMMDHPSLARLLQNHGARDSQQYFKDPSVRLGTLAQLINECEHEITMLMMQSLQAGGYTTSTVAKELGKRLQHWEWRRYYFKKMRQFCQSIAPPGPPKQVQLSVTSSERLTVVFSPPDSEEDSRTVITRYRIEWSQSQDFAELAGERTTADVHNREYTIPELKEGERYYVRLSACNLAGFGPSVPSSPPSAIPSTWHTCAGSKPRYEGSFNSILTLGAHTKNFYTQNSAATILTEASTIPSPSARQKSIKKGISKLFGNSVKYHKVLKSGLYLALLYYCDDNRILATADDNIPIVEVGDEYSRGTLGSDISWLNRVLCATDLIKTLRDISGTCVQSPSIHFRNKLLTLLADIQSSLGLADLGQLYPQPYFDAGVTVLVVVNRVDPSRSPGSSLKWTTVQRFARKRSASHTPLQLAGPIPDRIALDTTELIAYSRRCREPLPRGLYVGYYQGMSTMGYVKMLSSHLHPSVLPHKVVRGSPNVSREEWEWLASLRQREDSHQEPPNELVRVFHKQLSSAIKQLIEELGLCEDDVKDLRMYTKEIIELNESVTFLVLMPSIDRVCMPPGSDDVLLAYPHTMAVPIRLFMFVQFLTYQQAFLKMYAQLSARLELELAVAQYKKRQAFTKEEMGMANEACTCLEQFNERLEGLWQRVTWTDDVLKRSREPDSGTPLHLLLAWNARQKESPSTSFVKIQPMYNTGLALGTTVKLNISQATTVSSVVRLSVLQLDGARRSRGKQGPNITENDLQDFYISASTAGTDEVVIPNNFLMTELPSKWPNCRLFLKRYSESKSQSVIDQGLCTSV